MQFLEDGTKLIIYYTSKIHYILYIQNPLYIIHPKLIIYYTSKIHYILYIQNSLYIIHPKSIIYYTSKIHYILYIQNSLYIIHPKAFLFQVGNIKNMCIFWGGGIWGRMFLHVTYNLGCDIFIFYANLLLVNVIFLGYVQ